MDHNHYPPQPQYQPPQYPHPPPVDAPVHYHPLAPDGRQLAGPGQRFLARLVDSLLAVIAVIVPVGIGVAFAASVLPSDSPAVPAVIIPVLVLGMIGVPYLYEVEYPLRRNGQTPGKQVLKIAVAMLEPGAPLTRGALAKRFLAQVAANILSNCYIGFLDPLWMLWDKPYRQCLHDKWPRTVVVRLQWADDPAGSPAAYRAAPPVRY
jgi:uncharacterized RDD family membrane protein YckC